MTNYPAGILLAGAAVFASFVAGWLWSVLAYFIHMGRSRDVSSDLFQLQQQLCLRNSQEPFGTTFELISILRRGWSDEAIRQHHRRRVSLACWPLFALSFWLASIFAGVFSSRIATPGYKSSDVLVAHVNCGLWNFSTPGLDSLSEEQAKVLQDTNAARAHARTCYSQSPSSIDAISCSFYTVPRLTYSPSALPPACLFGAQQSADNFLLNFMNGQCDVTNNVGSHLMSTILLDSHKDLGINARKEERVRFQKNTTCSPVSIVNGTSNYTSPFDRNKQYSGYNFGPVRGVSNYIYLFNPLTRQDIVGYQLT